MNLAGVDLVSIRLVVFCAESGSLSAAARRGNMSLSTASHRLSNLEVFFKTRLFERDHRGLQLTEAGAVFVSHAHAVLNALHRLNDQILSMSVHARAEDMAVPLREYPPTGGLKKSEYRLTPCD
jgi:DNA-binding transcriptional LysR family regulator